MDWDAPYRPLACTSDRCDQERDGWLAFASDAASKCATAQFFINAADNAFLNFRAPNAQGWGYAVFGRVVEGQDVVDRIEAVKTGRRGFHDDVPLESVTIDKAVEVA